MCGRYALGHPDEAWADLRIIWLFDGPEWEARYNIALGQHAPVVVGGTVCCNRRSGSCGAGSF